MTVVTNCSITNNDRQFGYSPIRLHGHFLQCYFVWYNQTNCLIRTPYLVITASGEPFNEYTDPKSKLEKGISDPTDEWSVH